MVVSDVVEIFYLLIWVLMMRMYSLKIHYLTLTICVSLFLFFLLNHCLSVAQSCLTLLTPWTAAHQASLSFTVSQRLLKLMSIESMMPPNFYPLLPPSPPAPNLSQHRVFSNELVLQVRCPKDWSFSSSISLSNDYSGLISFRTDRLDLLTFQGTLKSPPTP